MYIRKEEKLITRYISLPLIILKQLNEGEIPYI